MIKLHTNFGVIALELDAEKAPESAKNFLAYAEAGHYDNTIFHRVIDGFMIQGGGFEPGMKQKPCKAPIKNEADNGLKNNAYNEFLNFKAPNGNGWGYCVFGKVVEGTDVVDKIKGVKTGNAGFHQDVPKEDVIIERAEIC